MPAIVNPIGVEHGAVYEILGPDGSRAVINNPADPDFVGFTNPESGGGVSGLERGGVRESGAALPEADGRRHGAYRYDGISFTIGGIIPAEPRPEAGEYVDTDLVDRVNLVANGQAQTGTGWSSYSNTTRTPAQVNTFGGFYMLGAAIAAAGALGLYRGVGTATTALVEQTVPGKTYTFAFDLLFSSVANRRFTPSIEWRDANFGLISTSTGNPVSTPQTTLNVARATGSVTAVCPPGAFFVRIVAAATDPTTVTLGETFGVTRFSFYEGDFVGTFDGDTPGGEWIGAQYSGNSRTYTVAINDLINPRFDAALGGWTSTSGTGYYTGAGGYVSPPLTTSNAHYIQPSSTPTASASSQQARVYEGGTFSAAVTVIAAVSGRYTFSMRDSNAGVVAYADGTPTSGVNLEAGVPYTATWTGIAQTVNGNGISPRFSVYRRNAAGTANQNLVAGESIEFRDAMFVRGASLRGLPTFSGRDEQIIPGRRTAVEGGATNVVGRHYLIAVTRTFVDSNLVWAQRQARILAATDAMLADGTLRWKPSNAPPVQVKFRQQQPTRITGKRPKNFLFAGITERHVIESQDVASTVIELSGATVGGVTSPVGSPVGSDAAVFGGATVTNVGAKGAWPTFVFEGPMRNPSIRSVRYGRQLRLNYSLAVGETLVVTTQPGRRAIMLNGTADRYDALDWEGSTWFPIAAGDNDLRVGADSYSAGAKVTVAFRHSWG